MTVCSACTSCSRPPTAACTVVTLFIVLPSCVRLVVNAFWKLAVAAGPPDTGVCSVAIIALMLANTSVLPCVAGVTVKRVAVRPACR